MEYATMGRRQHLGSGEQDCQSIRWEEGDEIVVKIAGTRTSGIHQTEDANPKWASSLW